MKLVTFRNASGADRVGAWTADDRIVDLKTAAEMTGSKKVSMFDSMLALIEGGDEALAAARALEKNPPAQAVAPLSAVRLRAPIPRPPRMRAMSCFPRHLAQAATGYARMKARESTDPEAALKAATGKTPGPTDAYYTRPVYWAIDIFSVGGMDDEVKWPQYSNWVDYELELAAVVGKRGKDISKADAQSYIFGYTIMNDLSARDEQMEVIATGLSTTAKGKDFDGGYPLGPCIVTADSIDIYNLKATLRVNGEVWGTGHSGERHWTFADGIVYMSQAGTMVPGEIITSATVANCAGMENERKGSRGDVVEVEVEGIGTLRTKII